jgi:hypothetical protein
MLIGLATVRKAKKSPGTAAFPAWTLLSLPDERYTDQNHRAEIYRLAQSSVTFPDFPEFMI